MDSRVSFDGQHLTGALVVCGDVRAAVGMDADSDLDPRETAGAQLGYLRL
jgi:hypothetical protein